MTAFGNFSLSDTSESGLPVSRTSPGGGNILRKAGQVKSFLPVYESDVNIGSNGLVEALLGIKQSPLKNLLVIIGFAAFTMEVTKAKCSTLGRMPNSASTSSSGILKYKERVSV